MAATATSKRFVHAHTNGKLTDCPMCGQPLLDHDAVERVEHAQDELDRKVEAAIQLKAGQLAKQLAKRELETAQKQVERLGDQLAAQKTALASQKKEHEAELRKLRTSLRAELAGEAEKTARNTVQRELRQRDTLIKRLKDENDVQQRRIEHLTADERGEMNEEELVARLQAAFPDDRVERQGRGRAGADIVHAVRYSNGDGTVTAGRIVYECKDTLQWNNNFVDQAAKARITHDTPHVVIVSRAFPRSEEELCVRDGIPIVAPARLVELSHVLRDMVIGLHCAGLTKDGQSAKTTELYSYLAGNEFRQAFDVLVDSASELRELLRKERTAHERTWAKRQQVYNEFGGKAAAIDGRLRIDHRAIRWTTGEGRVAEAGDSLIERKQSRTPL